MVPDRWLALSVRPPEGGDPEPLPLLLTELGGQGAEEKEGAFLTYLPPPEDPEGFLASLQARLRDLYPPHGAELTWRWQPHEDWAVLWRRGLGARRVTPRITVAPTWEVPEPGPGEKIILLDPGMAFGTVEHATTRGCLRLLDPRVRAGDRIADVGAGSGVLSMAAAALGASFVMALEMDDISCEVARENLEANGLQDQVRVVQARVEGAEPLPLAPYHGILANLQLFLLLPLLEALRKSLLPGGWLILSGVLQEEREAILAGASEAGLALEEEDREDEWWSGAFSILKPSP